MHPSLRLLSRLTWDQILRYSLEFLLELTISSQGFVLICQAHHQLSVFLKSSAPKTSHVLKIKLRPSSGKEGTPADKHPETVAGASEHQCATVSIGVLVTGCSPSHTH